MNGKQISEGIKFVFGKTGVGTTIYIIFLFCFLYSEEFGIDSKIVIAVFGFILNILLNSKDEVATKIGKEIVRSHSVIFLMSKGVPLKDAQSEVDSWNETITQKLTESKEAEKIAQTVFQPNNPFMEQKPNEPTA